jgi:hypothetical protein
MMYAPRICRRASIASFIPSLVWAIIFGTLFGASSQPWLVFAASKSSRQKNHDAAQDNYVGSVACSRCHLDIYRTFSRTRMGRSLKRVTPLVLKDMELPGTVQSDSLDRHFEVFVRDGRLFQSEYQSRANGDDVFRNAQQIEWIIGAGVNGFGGLIKRGSYLFEAPLSFFARADKWDLSPGYENTDIGFNRPIVAGCISCHSGRPSPADQDTGKFEPVPFSQTAIGCENCHGPGEEHIRAMGKNSQSPGSQIVDPGRLSAELENDICMSCHEAGDSRVPRPGKTYQDFRPGTPLDDTLSILMVPLKRGDPDNKDHVQHYFEMSMSKCFRASAGQLRCATCHDPHVEPSASEAPAFFNSRCMNCHANRPCKLQQSSRRQTSPPDNCIGCHMPLREATETAHTSLTNHRILARPGEPWPDEAFQQTTEILPDLVHVNRAQDGSTELPALVLLEAYREIAERRPEYLAAYQRTLGELERTNPDVAVVQLALGRRDLTNGEIKQATLHLERAVELDPNRGLGFFYLSEALSQQVQLEDAIVASEKAVSLDPYNSLFQKALIDRLIAARKYDKALAAMGHYLQLFPEDSFMRNMLEFANQ